MVCTSINVAATGATITNIVVAPGSGGFNTRITVSGTGTGRVIVDGIAPGATSGTKWYDSTYNFDINSGRLNVDVNLTVSGVWPICATSTINNKCFSYSFTATQPLTVTQVTATAITDPVYNVRIEFFWTGGPGTLIMTIDGSELNRWSVPDSTGGQMYVDTKLAAGTHNICVTPL